MLYENTLNRTNATLEEIQRWVDLIEATPDTGRGAQKMLETLLDLAGNIGVLSRGLIAQIEQQQHEDARQTCSGLEAYFKIGDDLFAGLRNIQDNLAPAPAPH
ncbi:hypothetical protein [Geopseudomonas aromaticivorans]